MANMVYRQMPAPRELPQQIPAPGQKLGCKSPRVGANFRCRSSGVRGGMVMGEIGTCIMQENVPRGPELVSRWVKANWTDFNCLTWSINADKCQNLAPKYRAGLSEKMKQTDFFHGFQYMFQFWTWRCRKRKFARENGYLLFFFFIYAFANRAFCPVRKCPFPPISKKYNYNTPPK